MSRQPQRLLVDGSVPRYRGAVRVTFPAIHSVPGLEPTRPEGRPHGHDFTATFLFESTTTLAYPGVVVDDDMRTEIVRHVEDRLAYRDLDKLLGRPPTCAAIAEYLASWHRRSARVSTHAHLTSLTVTTGSGGHGEIHLPHPLTQGHRR